MANDQKHLLVIARLIAGALIGGGDAAAGQAMTTPLERAISTPRGQLRTPTRTSPTSLPKVSRYTDLTTAMAAMEAVVVAAWRHPSPIRFGFMAMTTTRCSG
jgi:hypothetical protein